MRDTHYISFAIPKTIDYY